MEYAVALIVLAALVALAVSVPLRSRGETERREEARLQELQAAKEAKYREIRDAELDREMGKLSRADWRAVDRELRAEAIEILRELDRLEGRSPEEQEGRSPGEEGRSPGEEGRSPEEQEGRSPGEEGRPPGEEGRSPEEQEGRSPGEEGRPPREEDGRFEGESGRGREPERHRPSV
jgi:hypothetical protein